MNQAISKSIVRELSLIGLSAILLIVYLAGSVQIESIHNLVHQQDNFALLHTPDLEKDTCHLSVYHPDLNKGCKHPSHLSELKKCSICDLGTHSVHLFSISLINLHSSEHGTIEDYYHPCEGYEFLAYQSSRAPPTI